MLTLVLCDSDNVVHDGRKVGAVESCVGGTPVTLWTPPSGSLYVQHIKPLLPMTFAATLWYENENENQNEKNVAWI